MVVASMSLKARNRRVFDSVFESTNSNSLPTPELGFTAPGQPFGGPKVFSHDRSQAPVSDIRDFHPPANPSADVREQVSFDRSWHEVTSHLCLLQATDTFDHDWGSPTNSNTFPAPGPGFFAALKVVLQPEVYVPRATQTEDLVSWYSGQVRHHFLNSFLPAVYRTCEKSTPHGVLQCCLEGLSRVHHLYLHGLSFILQYLDGAKPGTSKFVMRIFCRDLHAIVSNSLFAKVSHSVRELLTHKINIVLEIPAFRHGNLTPNERQKHLDVSVREETRRELLALVESLHNIGLGGENFQILFAEIMNELMSYYIQETYGRAWSRPCCPEHVGPHHHQSAGGSFEAATGPQNGSVPSSPEHLLLPRAVNNSLPSRSVKDLCEWIENKYSRLAVQVLSKLDKIEVAWSDMEKWKEMSVGRLAGLRTKELFDIVVDWPNSNEGLRDLRTAVTTPQRRLQLTEVFSANLKERLLHPGASTLQILRTYISMIWSFHSLDHSKVLLDRVAYPLQVYLCSREDAVKIVITGLLSDTEDASGNPVKPSGERLVELAIMLDQGSEKFGRRQDEELDWNDMDWVPDPVDAGPGYRRSKNADVIGTLIGVLGSQEIFIKEFQNIISENLLKLEGDFEKEVWKAVQGILGHSYLPRNLLIYTIGKSSGASKDSVRRSSTAGL
jgi:anaphase-promoting complex subunit 2